MKRKIYILFMLCVAISMVVISSHNSQMNASKYLTIANIEALTQAEVGYDKAYCYDQMWSGNGGMEYQRKYCRDCVMLYCSSYLGPQNHCH